LNELAAANIINQDSTLLTPIEVMLGVDEQGRTTARKLYEFLGLAVGQFSRWGRTNILENQFAVAGEDYEGFDINVEGNMTKDYKLSASFAKKLAMGTHNERGEQAKNYFIKVEDKLKQVAIDMSALSLETQLLLKLSQSIAKNELEQKKLQTEVKETKEEVQAIKDIIIINPKAEWRRETNRILNTIAKDSGQYKEIKEEVYMALKERGKCRPKTLISNLQDRAIKNGMAPSKAGDLNVLDVLENDARLREVYIQIVKEMAIKYGVKVKQEQAC